MNRPFDAKRYKRLLEGLEVTTLKLSEVIAGNRAFRFDAQYFGKTALSAEAEIERGKWEFLSNAATKVASFGAYALTNQFTYVDEGVPFLRCQNIRDGFVDFTNVLYVNSAANDLLAKSVVLPGMVLLTMSGSVGNAAVALPEWAYPVNSNQDVAKITPNSDIDPFYFSAFLNSRFGRIQTDRLPVGSVQQHIFLWMIERLKIARFGDALESGIARAVSQAYDSEREARKQAATAETSLTAALGLDSWQPPQPLSYRRRASQAFSSGRLDSEYYEPAYAELRAHIHGMGGARLGDLVAEKIRRGISPEYVESGDLPVINSQRVGKDHITLEGTRTTQRSLLPSGSGTRTGLIRQWDVLLNSTGRITIGRCQCVLDDVEAVVDNHVSIIRPSRGLDPVYLACFLNSRFGLMQTEQSQTGSSGQIEMRPELIENFEIWVAPEKVQRIIRAKILEAHAARHRARKLLAAAQRAVEIAIEQDEAAALAYLAKHGIEA